jgi:taurine dioxygenase
LLSELKTHVDQDHLYYTHRWKEGDVLVWDNRCCNHKREAIPEGQRRVFYRSVIGGCRPY